MSLGLGSVVASAVSAAPWLAAISRNKTAVFVAVAALLAVNYWLAIVRPRAMNCAPGEMCHTDSPAMRVNRALFWTSVGIYAGAIAFTYGALLWVRMQQ